MHNNKDKNLAMYFWYEVSTRVMYLLFSTEKTYPAENLLGYYRCTLAIPFLDCIISELDLQSFPEQHLTFNTWYHP